MMFLGMTGIGKEVVFFGALDPAQCFEYMRDPIDLTV